MKNNKPKYNLFKNSSYAISGLIEAVKSETSLKIELVLTVILLPLILIIDISLSSKLMLIISGFAVIIVELINTSIENVVDLITTEFHPLAKNAKDIAAAAVLVAVLVHILCWILVLS